MYRKDDTLLENLNYGFTKILKILDIIISKNGGIDMGFWLFYVLPFCISFVLMLMGIHLLKERVKIGAYLVYFLAGLNCVIAGIFGVSYIYALVLELVTPSSLTKWGWMAFWNDNVIFAIATVILIAMNVLIWRRSRKIQLKIR